MDPSRNDPRRPSSQIPQPGPDALSQGPRLSWLVSSVAAVLLCQVVVAGPLDAWRLEPGHERFAGALGVMLVAYWIFAGYVGGRVAVRSGVSHRDGRTLWLVATWSVGLGALALRWARMQWLSLDGSEPAADVAGAGADSLFAFVVATGFARFGLAMGSFREAYLRGQASLDEDDEEEES